MDADGTPDPDVIKKMMAEKAEAEERKKEEMRRVEAEMRRRGEL